MGTALLALFQQVGCKKEAVFNSSKQAVKVTIV